jgi:hypothetical protein
LNSRWKSSWPLFAVGALGVVSGGLVAAAIAPAPTEHGSWAAAYLVLVVGVAQIALAAGQAAFLARPPTSKVVALELVSWNVANATVIAGTVTDTHPVVYTGGAILAVALAIFVSEARGMTALPGGRKWPVHAFRALVAVLLVSIPVGLVLATIRNGG